MQLLEFGSIRGQFISDGYFMYPRPFLYRGEVGEPVDLPYRCLYLEAGGRRILVDTGAGPSGPFCGQLMGDIQFGSTVDSKLINTPKMGMLAAA